MNDEDSTIATIVDELGRREGGGHDNLTLALIETRINSKLKPKMSKQTKLMLMLLGALAAISIIFNVAQCASKPDTEELTQQVEQLQKEVTAKTDSIKSLHLVHIP